MEFKTDKILGGLNIGGIKLNKTTKQDASKIKIDFKHYSANAGELTIRSKSSFVVPPELADKFADVVPPKGKPTQLVISDADYIPDREYTDAEV